MNGWMDGWMDGWIRLIRYKGNIEDVFPESLGDLRKTWWPHC